MQEIVLTIVLICAILVIDFVAVIIIEDKRRKRKRRRKNKGESEKAVFYSSDLTDEAGQEGEWDTEEEEPDREWDTDELGGEESRIGQQESNEGNRPAEKEILLQETAAEEENTVLREEPEKMTAVGKKTVCEKNDNSEQTGQDIQEVISEKKEKPIIKVDNVTMKFRIATGSTSGLKDFVIQKIKKQISTRELLALDHVSFEVLKGEVVGIIGTNGSGKSTLLKIVSGALNPSEGKVSVDKKKVQLLSLGAGFDTELSARENVYLNGAIIGYSKDFINKNYEKIVEFSELEGFMDEKVKNFSSGMVSRLAFSIATAGDAAEILILDEVLSVGDEFFKKKSLARVKEMIHGGSTVLMVSHGMNTILENCTKVVWIEKGKLQMVGDAKTVCNAYRNQFS